MTTPTHTAAPPRPQLLSLGDGGWVACNPAAPDDSPDRILAYVERKDGVVYVLWVRAHAGVVEFASLDEALDAVASHAEHGDRAAHA